MKRKRDSKGLKNSKIRLENSRKQHDIFPKKTTRSTIKHDTNLIVKHDTESWVLAYRTIPDSAGFQKNRILLVKFIKHSTFFHLVEQGISL